MYRPRIASKRWTEQAPEYVLACYDYGNKTIDRYTVLLGGSQREPSMGRNIAYLAMSDAPEHPQGFSQWGECGASNRAGLGKQVRWLDLPKHIRQHVIARVTQ
jgi:hypothetical protein